MKLVNLYHKVATRMGRKIQSILGMITVGARAIILNADNQILLVKHTYQPHWYLPGGGVKKGESTKAAVIRELNEEVGIIPSEDPQLFGVYFNIYLGVSDYPVIYTVKKFSLSNAHSPEIEKIGWFHYHALPEMVSPGTKRRLDEYFKQTPPSEKW